MLDPSLLKAYQLGIAIGLLIVSTLILVPGRTETSAVGGSVPKTAKEQLACTAADDGQTGISKDDVSNLQRQPKQQAFSPAEGNTAPPNDATGDSYWTPHRRVNATIYAILILAMIMITVQSYSDGKSKPTTLLNILWHLYFPKEAAVFRGSQQQPNRGEE